jgi:ABC-type lipoprotein release transport system permease subunit
MRLPVRVLATLGWRNLWRNPRRTGIMLAAITVGVWAMVFLTALMRGMVDQMVADGVRTLPGHVQIHHPDYRDDPSIVNSFAEPDGELLAALNAPPVRAWSARLRVPAVVMSERESRGLILLGVDPEREASVSFFADSLADGRFLDGADDRGLVVGRTLLERLETDLGKRVVVMSQDPDNQVADRGFRIVGVYTANLPALEEQFVLGGRTTVATMLGTPGVVSEIAVLGDDYRDMSPLLEALTEPAGPGLEVLPWNQIDRYLGSMLGVMDGFVLVWMVVVFLALSFGLVNTLVMAVFERVREIGLMQALGVSPAAILAQVLIESCFLLLLGLAAGNGLAWITVAPLVKNGIDLSIVGEGLEMFGASAVLYPTLLVSDMILSTVVVLVLGLVASLSPAWRASRYEPVEAITKV